MGTSDDFLHVKTDVTRELTRTSGWQWYESASSADAAWSKQLLHIAWDSLENWYMVTQPIFHHLLVYMHIYIGEKDVLCLYWYSRTDPPPSLHTYGGMFNQPNLRAWLALTG